MNTSPIPVTVLTGFLGSGKTTLLNRILAGQHGKKIAVIENEFGEVGVDNQLVIEADEEIFEMNNGCICCTVRGDLIRILSRLAKRAERLDGVIIETTGLANPGPVALTFFSDAEVRAAYRLDGIVTLVDARHIAQHWDDSDEAKKQIAFADTILLNKTDLVPAEALDVIEARIRHMNPAARLHRTQQAEVALNQVLDIGGFNLERATALDPQFLEPEYPFEWGGAFVLPTGGAQLQLEAGPDPTMDAVLVPLRSFEESEINAARDDAMLAFSTKAEPLGPGNDWAPGRTLRQLELTSAPAAFRLHPVIAGPHALFTQHHPDEFSTTFSVAGQKLELLWSRNFKPNHTHDDAVASVGVTLPGNLDGARLNSWLAELLRTKGNDIFRSKGVLAIKGSDKRLVFQGVHMLFDAQFGRPWGVEPRTNTFVFIGHNLDRAALTTGFQNCLVT